MQLLCKDARNCHHTGCDHRCNHAACHHRRRDTARYYYHPSGNDASGNDYASGDDYASGHNNHASRSDHASGYNSGSNHTSGYDCGNYHASARCVFYSIAPCRVLQDIHRQHRNKPAFVCGRASRL